MTRPDRLVAWVSALYGLLLRLYPPRFRRRYGCQMRELFEDTVRLAARDRGVVGAFGRVMAAVVETPFTALLEWVPHRSVGCAAHRGSPSGAGACGLLRDLGTAFRSLRRAPVFAATATLTLGLGIGANTAIFSVVNGVLMRPLPYEDPSALVTVGHTVSGGGLRRVAQTPFTYFTYRRSAQAFEDIGVWSNTEVAVTGVEAPERVSAVWVTDGVLALLRISPVIGRRFTSADVARGAAPTVILEHGYWQRRFGADPAVVGRSLRIEGTQWEVIGVLPPKTRFLDLDVAVVLPLRLNPAAAPTVSFDYHGLGRLRAGVSLDQARRDLARVVPLAAERLPGADGAALGARLGPDVRPLKETIVRDIGPVLWILFASVGLVFLLACFNVANLSLVRAESRRREIAVRAALGASRARLASYFLAESVVLGLAGGVVGLGLAETGLVLLRYLRPGDIPRLDSITVDTWVLIFAFAISVAAGILFGGVPLWRHWRTDLASALKDASRGTSSGPARHRLRNGLAVGQVALALVLLVGAGLMLRSVYALNAVPLGFERPEEVLAVRLSIPHAEVPDPQEVVGIHERLTARLAEITGAVAVGATSAVPTQASTNNNVIHVEGLPTAEGQVLPRRFYQAIAGDYFRTMGIPLLAGRSVTWDDIRQRRAVGVISESLAREFWGEPSRALGRRIRHGAEDGWREIVGVVGDVRDRGADQPAPGIAYWPVWVEDFVGFPQWVRRSMTYLIRTERSDPRGLLPEVRAAVASVHPQLPLADARTVADIVAQSNARRSFALIMLVVAAVIALALGTVGIYGVIGYLVAQRRREIGVRRALGARRRDVTGLVLRQATVIAGIGVAVGLLGALGLARLMSALLFQIGPADPIVLVAATFGVIGVSLAAGYLPARRAASVPPTAALHGE